MRGERARLTVPDVVYLLASIAFLGALAPVFYDSMEAKANLLDAGTAYLLQLLLPFIALVLLYMVFAKATAGVR